MIYNIGSRVVNNFLIPFDTGFILVDTGYAGGFTRFKKKLEKHHIRPEQIKYVFLTHAHDDHAGFLNEVLGTPGHTSDHISLDLCSNQSAGTLKSARLKEMK